LSKTTAPLSASYQKSDTSQKTYAEVFTGVRQDSGDPEKFIQTMRAFYKEHGITEKKTMVFSDSLNIEKSLQYKQHAEEAGFAPSFGIGTFFTSESAVFLTPHSPSARAKPLI
jgi:nicotinate phosphoribosyltransferase